MHCKYRELFVLSMAGKKGPGTIGSFPALLSLPGRRFLFRRVWQTSVYTVAGDQYPRVAVLRVSRDSNNESGVYIGFRANSRSAAGYSGGGDSAICLGIAEFTLYSLTPGARIRRANTHRFIFLEIYNRAICTATRYPCDEILNHDFNPR